MYTTSNGTFLELGCTSSVHFTYTPSLLLTILPTEPTGTANYHPSVCSHLLPTTAERTWTASTWHRGEHSESHLWAERWGGVHTWSVSRPWELCKHLWQEWSSDWEGVCMCVFRVHLSLPQRRVTYLSCPLVGILESSDLDLGIKLGSDFTRLQL